MDDKSSSFVPWYEQWPHMVYASVLLLDGKIENWKVGGSKKDEPMAWTIFWKMDRLTDYKAISKGFEVNTPDEHAKVFDELAPEWFKQWPHADDYRLARAY
jgi:hypothetical protein